MLSILINKQVTCKVADIFIKAVWVDEKDNQQFICTFLTFVSSSRIECIQTTTHLEMLRNGNSVYLWSQMLFITNLKLHWRICQKFFCRDSVSKVKRELRCVQYFQKQKNIWTLINSTHQKSVTVTYEEWFWRTKAFPWLWSSVHRGTGL